MLPTTRSRPRFPTALLTLLLFARVTLRPPVNPPGLTG